MSRFVSSMSLIVVLVSGCAFDLADVRYSPATLQSLSQPERTFVLTGDVAISQAPCPLCQYE